MKIKRIMAFTLCLACFLTSSVFANSTVSTGAIVDDSNTSTSQEITESDEWVEAMSDLEELSTDDLLSLAQETPVNYYESNRAVRAATAVASTSEEDATFQETWATYDYDTAPDSVKENIVVARTSIVYYTEDISWAVDGCAKIMNADGSLEDIDEYSDLFPYWDLEPISDFYEELNGDFEDLEGSSDVSYFNTQTSLLATRTRYMLNKNAKVYIEKAGTSNTPHTLNSGLIGKLDAYSIGVWATQIPGASYNVGGYAGDSGDSFKVNLVAGQGLRVYPKTSPTTYYMFRVSTYSTTGTGVFQVDYEKN